MPRIGKLVLVALVCASGHAFIAPRGRGASMVSMKGAIDEALAMVVPKDGEDEAVLRSNFENLASRTGDEAAVRIIKNNNQVLRWETDRVCAFRGVRRRSADARVGLSRKGQGVEEMDLAARARLLHLTRDVGAAFDAWVLRYEGDAAAATALVSKNPGLLYCKPRGKDGIENAPLGQAEGIASAMEFFRFGQ